MSRARELVMQYKTKPTDMKSEINKYFERPGWLLDQMVNFSYVLTPINQRLLLHHHLTDYLGYSFDDFETLSFYSILHPNERKKLLRLERELIDYVKRHNIPTGNLAMSIVNHIKKSDNNYIKVCRYVYPIVKEDIEEEEMICSYCMDITSHSFSDKVTFQIIQTAHATFDLEEAQQHFAEVMSEPVVQFTDRQLEVLRVWASTDSVKSASELLQLQPRTLETHLKNIRKRLEVRRTMDAVMYAKEHGLI